MCQQGAVPGGARPPMEEAHNLSTSPDTQRGLRRWNLLGRKLTPPGGLRSPQEVRTHWEGRAEEMERWSETAAEATAVREYRDRLSATSDADLWAAYEPFIDAPTQEKIPASRWWT